jgi:hypothetical protein
MNDNEIIKLLLFLQTIFFLIATVYLLVSILKKK